MREYLPIYFCFTQLKKVVPFSSELTSSMVRLIGNFARLYSILKIHTIQIKLLPLMHM